MNIMKLCDSGLFLFFIFAATSGLCSGCLQHERQALLTFKNSLVTLDPTNRLSSWNGNNCFLWFGVGCDNATQYVTRLDLRTSNAKKLEASELHTSLSELTRLSYLDLSGIHFSGSSAYIPEFIGSMTQLRFLNLSSSGLSGVVPHQMGNLSSLRVIDLSGTELVIDDFTWVARLLSLKYLDLGGVTINRGREFDKVLFYKLPSLLELRLSNCSLSNSHFHYNTTRSNIQILDLSLNSFEGQMPLFLQNLTSLRLLDLSRNQLNSSIPAAFKNLVQLNLARNRFSRVQDTGVLRRCQLKRLDLSFNYIEKGLDGPFECTRYGLDTLVLSNNKLRGKIPTSLDMFTTLKRLDLHGNMFTGTIPELLGNLTCLIELDLSSNQLTGSIPKSLGKLSMLKKLDLSENLLNGTFSLSMERLSRLEFVYLYDNLFSSISPSLGNVSQLRFLDLTSNLLQGPLPDCIGQLSKLEFLDVSNNSLSGTVTEAHFANTYMLKYLAATSNPLLHFKIAHDWEPPFQMIYVQLGSCKIKTEFPQWLRTQVNLVVLFLPNTSIYGPLPDWLQERPVITLLDLSHNFLTGPLTNLFPNHHTTKPIESVQLFTEKLGYPFIAPRMLFLKDNLFNGSIPDSLCNATDLETLDLSRNMLSGNIPDCFGNLRMLQAMLLSHNRLSGVIPSTLGKLGASLQWLQLNNNSFHGQLPDTLANCTKLSVLDLGENELFGRIPIWIGEKLEFLAILRLHRNKFTGLIPVGLCQRFELQIIDFGYNNLTGTIPRCFNNLSRMAGNASSFYLWGMFEPSFIQIMKGASREYTTPIVYLTNMDLSSNNLVGEIPEDLTFLKGLFGLNLSNNHLTGRIPDRIGHMKSLISLDVSGNHISGMIPQSLSRLTSLSHLNVSHNNLSGRIPTGPQLQTLIDPSIYIPGNDNLCGSPLTKRCSTSDEASVMEEDDNNDDEEVSTWVYSIASGFITGFLVTLGLFSKKLYTN
ncbi:putative leucine-rich repeat protein [Tanacetum coccineum]